MKKKVSGLSWIFRDGLSGESTEKYKKLTHIRVDVSDIPGVPGMSPLGLPIFIQTFEIIYIYGGTAEIKAQIAWKEDVRLRDLSFPFTADIVLTNSLLFYRVWRSGAFFQPPCDMHKTDFLIGAMSLLYTTMNKMSER